MKQLMSFIEITEKEKSLLNNIILANRTVNTCYLFLYMHKIILANWKTTICYLRGVRFRSLD